MARFWTKVLSRPADFWRLLHGYSRLRAASYVASQKELNRLFGMGYERIALLLGYTFAGGTPEDLRTALTKEGVLGPESLLRLMDEDKLVIYRPSRTDHSKLYFLENETQARAMTGSMNLSGSGHVNEVWGWDFDLRNPEDGAQYAELLKNFEFHLKGCEVFMGDLRELVRGQEGPEREEKVKAWLLSTSEDDADVTLVINKMTQDIILSEATETVYELELPIASTARQKMEKLVADVRVGTTGDSVLIDKAKFLGTWKKTMVPPMAVETSRGQVVMILDGRRVPRTTLTLDPEGIRQDLAHIEEYIGTVDLGQTHGKLREMTKVNMYEALLYVLASPFFNELHKMRMRHLGRYNKRGPRFLYITGGTHNGKSTFMRFALEILSGAPMSPLGADEFTLAKVRDWTARGGCFPLLFDDLKPRKLSEAQQVLSLYWERWWRDDLVVPQVVLSSNFPPLRGGMESRIKRVDFDVRFSGTDAENKKLGEIFRKTNTIFPYFANVYLKMIASEDVSTTDELYLARRVVQELYRLAGRPLPSFFPRKPVEDLFDVGKMRWQALRSRGKVTIRVEGDAIRSDFSPDMRKEDVDAYESYLSRFKYHRDGNTLTIENPADFLQWLELADDDVRPETRNLFLGRFRRRNKR